MVMFAFSYLGTSTYYIAQVVTNIHCTQAASCIRFNDLMYTCGIALICDVVPVAVLYA